METTAPQEGSLVRSFQVISSEVQCPLCRLWCVKHTTFISWSGENMSTILLRNDRLKSNQQRRTSVRRQETLTRHKKILRYNKRCNTYMSITRWCGSWHRKPASRNYSMEHPEWNKHPPDKKTNDASSLQFHSLATKRWTEHLTVKNLRPVTLNLDKDLVYPLSTRKNTAK